MSPLVLRLIVSGPFVAETPLHVGGAGAEGDVDLAWARDGQGRLVVPGTSLAGAWRAACEDPDDPIDRLLFGGRPADDAGGASLVTVEDALVTGEDATPVDAALLIRDHVGIDRRRGAAADDVLYRRAVLPAGTHVQLEVRLEVSAHHLASAELDIDELRSRFLAHVARLRAGIEIGGSVTRGLGRIALDANATVAEADVRGGGADALRRLMAPPARPIDEAVAGIAMPARPTATIEMPWRARTPVLVRASVEGEDVDQIPLVEPGRTGRLRLVLPGSSIKGALRAHAERICRTVRPSERELAERFLDQLAEAPDPVVALFGAAAEESAHGAPSWRGRGAVRVHEVTSIGEVPADTWREVIGEPRGEADRGERRRLSDATRERLAGAGLRQDYHVAIDRWTGGASPGALYSVLVPDPDQVAWTPIRLDVDLARLDASGHRDTALALLWLVVRDLAQGRIPIGAGATRGLGSIEADPGPRFTIEGVELTSPPPSWQDAWRAWIAGDTAEEVAAR